MQETQETWVQSLGQEDPLEGEMPTAPVFLPGECRQPGGLHSTGSQSAGHDWMHRCARKMELMVRTPGSQDCPCWGQCEMQSLKQTQVCHVPGPELRASAVLSQVTPVEVQCCCCCWVALWGQHNYEDLRTCWNSPKMCAWKQTSKVSWVRKRRKILERQGGWYSLWSRCLWQGVCLVLWTTGSSQCYFPTCRCRKKPEGCSTTSSSPYRIQLQVFWMVKPGGSQRTWVVNPTRDPRQFWPENGKVFPLSKDAQQGCGLPSQKSGQLPEKVETGSKELPQSVDTVWISELCQRNVSSRSGSWLQPCLPQLNIIHPKPF